MNLYSYTPSIDLHGLDKEYAVILTKEFISDHYSIKSETVRIIHGVGEGILRKAIHEYLKHEKKVLEYKTNYHNLGETLVTIKKQS